MRRATSSSTNGSSLRSGDATLPIGDRTMSTGSWTTASQADTTAGEGDGLFFASLNPLAPITIVLLHIGMSSHLEWSHTWPKLSEYHLLIPDLPQHSRSRHIKPFSFALAADHVAQMIEEHAHDGRAHMVGVSTGGFVAMEVIKRHPEVVLSAFLSGATMLKDSWKSLSSQPKIGFLGLSVLLHSPKSLLFKASGWAPEYQSEEVLKEIKRNNTARLYEATTRDTGNWSRSDMVEVGQKDKRIALIAGGKQDNVESMRDMGQLLESIGSKDGRESRAFVVKDAIHAWNLQFPLLFARGIRAWVEKAPMPEGFELLEKEVVPDDGSSQATAD